MKCTDLLTQDHKVILRSLDILQQMALCVENGESLSKEDVPTLLRFLRAFADEHHQLKEESALFPELLRTSSGQAATLRHMLFEHDQERSLVEGLEDALYSKREMEFVQLANRLTALIRNHIYKEENILFDIVAESLSAEQDEKVVAEFNKFEINAAFLADLRRLEWKYLRKVA